MFVTDPAAAPHEVRLTVNGQIHEGWTAVEVDLNLDALSGSFHLAVTRDWVTEGQKITLNIEPGSEAQVAIDGVTVITGYLDYLQNTYSNTTHNTVLEGRDKAGDLADCSVPIKDWHGQKLEAIVADICAPYGIQVACRTDTGAAFGKFAANPGDTCHATIERLLRQRGLWAWSDGGRLIIDSPKAGESVASFSPGNAVLEASGTFDMTERFSEYTVMGHHNPGGEDDGDDSADPEQRHPTGQAKDDGVTRYRPCIIVAETSGQGASFTERARHEARVRAAKSVAVTVKTTGWYNAQGELYRPGQTVTCDDALLEVAGAWIVKNVRLSQGEEGSLCQLTLADPAAFDRLAEPEKQRESGEEYE